MFQRAVIRLTVWYLLVIALLSIGFSVALYNVSNNQLNTLQRRQDALLRSKPGFIAARGLAQFNQQRINQIQDSKHIIGVNLIYFNLFIIVVGGAVSFLLAKRTLHPIEESLEAQNRFSADASHELRTPLTAMKTELEVALRDKDLNLAQSRALHISTLEEIEVVENLTANLLKIAQESTAGKVIKKKSVELSQVIEEGIRRVKPLAEVKNIGIAVEVNSLNVWGNEDRLVELFTILLDNAIKYSPEKSSVKIRVKKDDTNQIIITVEDSGIGIAATDITRIFDRFYRADRSRAKHATGGHGLGLSIAKKIVEMHKGSIHVKSKVGHGSTFTVMLPLLSAHSQ